VTATKTPLHRKSLTEQILEILEARIVNGELVPGSRLSEEAIAAEFGTSRSPVRDVLAALEREGFADRVGLRDRRVATPTRKFVLDTYETWIILEVNRTFISSKNATAEDQKSIGAVLEEMRDALKANRRKEYSRLAMAFPEMLHKRCDNLQLLSVLKDFEKYRRWLATLYAGEEVPSLMELEEHREIGQAYLKKDLPALTKSITSHVTKQRDQVLEKLESRDLASVV
jgi:DNA-binding GntR family transcriptional regulator